ncbi:pyridoxamine 5'-phosphate oxidase family protein [Candidatus Roseilinea sp. NK_OTU-006]|uniref:pyridoxamine 5'-phosphate oxidase family protein n=1 Tax=Candidatus Roseilinea sp. NK_OTU-006 TaxID=2704250 RepID=UPI00145DCCD5|nr:pyridoxamine 5'-phosphate oxidase family protein [Candidatus Roseilinea sp. NK_OTU-006]
MTLDEKQIAFLEKSRAAAMITVGDDGIARAVRVGIAMVDGKVWSSGTQDRARTKRLRKNPNCTLFVFDNTWSYLTLETRVRLIEGPDVPALSERLFRIMQNRPMGPLSWFGGEMDSEDFRRAMAEEGRLIYEFDIHRAYGLV